MPRIQSLPFWLHILIETPASLNFFFKPSEQISSPAAQANGIIRQYAVLLLVSNIIAQIFALRPLDQTGKNVATALSIYHLAPFVRAALRIIDGDDAYGQGLGGPWLHFMVHGTCFAALIGVGRFGVIDKTNVKE